MTIQCTSSQKTLMRLRVTAKGQVQGVGFRPFVFRLAKELELTGHVGNTSLGVNIEVQGRAENVRSFPKLLADRLPPLASLTGLETEETEVVQGEEAFRIVQSHGQHGHNVLISPDVGICDDCLADMFAKDNHRYLYPFTNCTNCGPRYTITRSIPYDRVVTSMACFPMCEECAKEYQDPLDRRFHAQPIACPKCGPDLWFVEGRVASTAPKECKIHGQETLLAASLALLQGKIVAVRGLGGFQLACDAHNQNAVATLRARKNRPHKSFALMVRDMDAVENICLADAEEKKLLSSPARPAVILKKRPCVASEHRLAEGVAPDLETLAVMLPTTPLHVVLFHHLQKLCDELKRPVPALVMTSGNASGDPICLGNREAIRRLGDTADCFLLHDRDILCRVDDSVLVLDKCQKNHAPLFFRRARGFVPSPIDLGRSGPSVLGMGADLKATICLTRKNHAFVGQHTGDLENVATAGFYKEVLNHLAKLLEVEPALVVTDLHPDFTSTICGTEMAQKNGLCLARLQHHAAHAAAVLAEHKVTAPALALVLDGFGLGEDGTVWGGELLSMDLPKALWRREGHLSTFALPGGDRATRAPWRIALTLARDVGAQATVQAMLEKYGTEGEIVLQMLERRLNTPQTSSCGRLFDAVSALLDITTSTSYEGQAAIRLETHALRTLPDMDVSCKAIRQTLRQKLGTLPKPDAFLARTAKGMGTVSSQALFARALALRENGIDAGLVALDFHYSLARALSRLAASRKTVILGNTLALAGGVLNNTLLRTALAALLEEEGFQVLVPHMVPPGDGGISLGQAAFGLALLENNMVSQGETIICQSRQ